MARGATLWTEAMDNFLADGEWHSTEEVLAAGAAEVPVERALEEMSKSNRANQSDESRRIAAGQKTLAQQSLMSMKRFGKVEITGSKPNQRVRKIADGSTAPGVVLQRVLALEAQVAELIAWRAKISWPETESVAVEWLREKEETFRQERATMIDGVVSDVREAPDGDEEEVVYQAPAERWPSSVGMLDREYGTDAR